MSTQFQRKQTLPGNDPELAIAGGSYGFDLVLYYIRKCLWVLSLIFQPEQAPTCIAQVLTVVTEYYSYNVQAMLVMFWYDCLGRSPAPHDPCDECQLSANVWLCRAAELCQLTYQVGERRKIRRLFRKLHAAGKLISWLLPLASILCLRIPALRLNFLAFILVADLPCQFHSCPLLVCYFILSCWLC